MIEVRPTRYGAPDTRVLLEAANDDLIERYGVGDENAVDPTDFDPPNGCFLVAVLAGEPVVCGGWRTLRAGWDPPVGEIKRMFAVPHARGTGAAMELLRALEDSARGHGIGRMVLETGTSHTAAIKFYQRAGYELITNYGYYRDEPDCRSFGRDL
jgi:GNAT superfamily N-acetyltransferase